MSEILTREEYVERIRDCYRGQGMGIATHDVLMHHDAALRAEVAALNDGARRNAALLAEKREKVAALRAEIALLKQEREFAREVDRDAVEVAELRAEIERLRRELSDERETSNRAVLYYSDQHRRTESAEARAEKAEREVEKLSEDFRDAHRAITEWMEKNEKLDRQLVNATAALVTEKRRAEKLAAALREIRTGKRKEDQDDGWICAARLVGIAAAALAPREERCNCGGRFLDPEDYRDHLPCPAVKKPALAGEEEK